MSEEVLLGSAPPSPQSAGLTRRSSPRRPTPPIALALLPSLKRAARDSSPGAAGEADNGQSFSRVLAGTSGESTRIKRRLGKPRKLRRVEREPQEDDGVDTPGAGPSRLGSRSISAEIQILEAPQGSAGAEPSPGQRTRSRSRSPPATSSTTPLTMRGLSKAPLCSPLRSLSTRSALAPPRSAHPPLLPCRSVYAYTRLNHIEEGTYGIVFRARCNATGEIYALKKLKLDEEKQGFPITSLREVMSLMTTGGHENVVGVREIVVGDTLNQIFIVMPFIEHDLKTLLQDMPYPFVQSEVKTLMLQLLSAIAHCHANWILHRDLKTSNLLMNNRGQIKVADFGLARTFGDPLGEMTQLVVTLWYRSPELLMGATEYTTAVDMWSVGCIFAELMQKEALFQGRGEIDQISRIFKLLGVPNDETWPGFSKMPLFKSINPVGPPYSSLRKKFQYLTEEGHDLLASLLSYDPARRINAEAGGQHAYFRESPLPKHPDLFSSFPSQAAGERRRKAVKSPVAPSRAFAKAAEGKEVLDLV